MQIKFRKILVFALSLISVSSIVRFWFVSRDMDKGSDAVAKMEERFIPVREALPMQRGVVGYVGEWDIPGADYDYWDQMAEYMLAQYTLAPLILKQGAVAEWNIAAMSFDSLQIWLQAHPTEFQVIPLKHGVYLLRRNK